MKRREFLKTSVLGIASTSATTAVAAYLPESPLNPEPAQQSQVAVDPNKVYSADPHRLFPNGLPTKQWVRFEAAGFAKPACGIVYHRDDVVPHGMPLGGVATGH